LNNILARAPLLAPLILVAACSTAPSNLLATGSIGQIRQEDGHKIQKGRASWYGPGFQGRRTASGERFNPGAMTAAHRSLPFGTRVRVVNESNGQSVVVRINDRGPYAGGRIIDLARGPAQALGLTSSGTAYVSLQRLD
jgi:rare lipoprotein A